MSKVNQLLDEYAQSHQNKTNIIIHKIFVPLIMFSILGLIWALPTFSFMESVNWALVVCVITLLYYLSLSLKYFIVMIPIIGLMYWGNMFLATKLNLLFFSVIVFIISWVFQFVGHKIEGKKPSFLQDILFLLVGPLWVAKSLFNLK